MIKVYNIILVQENCVYILTAFSVCVCVVYIISAQDFVMKVVHFTMAKYHTHFTAFNAYQAYFLKTDHYFL